MKRIMALNFLLLTTTAFSAQTIQIHTQLPAESPTAALILVVYDIDQDKKTPYFMNLTPGQTLETFYVEGNHFQIIQSEIQAPNVTFSPCAPTETIDNQSLIVNMVGSIKPDDLRCAFRKVAVIPQLSTPAPIKTTTPTIKSAAAVDPNAGSKTIANYLTALQNCKKGTFIADFDTQSVTYTILGMTTGHCDVTISTNQSIPLTCRFNQNDIALLTSSSEIQSYQEGTAVYSENSLNARIMKARCKSDAPSK